MKSNDKNSKKLLNTKKDSVSVNINKYETEDTYSVGRTFSML